MFLGALGLLAIALASASGDEDAPGYMVGMLSLEIVGFMWLLSINNQDKEDEDIDIYIGEKIKVPRSISGYEEKNYASIEALFRKAGFTNITTVPLHDLRMGFLKKPGNVKSISVNGTDITSGGKKFPSDAAVVISYHSMV